jgi:MraZ protein
MFFAGSFDHTVDEKGRVNIPASFRSQLPAADDFSFYVTLGREGCLYVFPPDVFEQMSIEMEKDTGSFLNPNSNKVVYTHIMALTQSCHCDAQGRLVIPKTHLEKAHIAGKVKIVGLKDKMQLWSPELFERYVQSLEMSSGNP